MLKTIKVLRIYFSKVCRCVICFLFLSALPNCFVAHALSLLGVIEVFAGSNVSDQARMQPLLNAIRSDDWKTVRRLLLLGANPPAGLSPVLGKKLGLEQLSLRLLTVSSDGDVTAINKLLNIGADPNVCVDLDDWLSPLARAAKNNHTEAVRLLIAYGDRVNDAFGYSMGKGWFKNSTALIWAARFDAFDCVKELLKNNANPNCQEVYILDAENCLERRGVTPLMASDDIKIMQILLKHAADPDKCGYDDFTPLMKASAACDRSKVELLIKYRANAEIVNSNGKMAEDIARDFGRNDVVDLIRRYRESCIVLRKK